MNYNDWDEFPKTDNWKNAINFIKSKSNNTLKIKEMLKILIYEADTIEDDVLTVAILYTALEENIVSLNEIKEIYGKDKAEIINFIIKNQTENFDNYVSRIFNCPNNK